MTLLLWQLTKYVVRALFILFCCVLCFLYGALVWYPFLKEVFSKKELSGAWCFIKHGGL